MFIVYYSLWFPLASLFVIVFCVNAFTATARAIVPLLKRIATALLYATGQCCMLPRCCTARKFRVCQDYMQCPPHGICMIPCSTDDSAVAA